MSTIAACINCCLAMFIVGSGVVMGKIIVSGLPVFLASGVRFFLSCLILLPIVLWADSGWSQFKSLTRKDMLGLFLLALFGQFIFTVSLLYGLQATGAMEAGIITSASPAVVALLAFVFYREYPTGRRLFGVGLAVAGLMIINLWNIGGANASGGGKLWGNLLILLAVFGESAFSLIRRMIRPEVSPMFISLALCLWGLVMFAPLALYEAWGFDYAAVNLEQWLSLIYFALIYTVVAYILWFRGVAHLPASTAGVCTAMMPLSGLTLSFFILGEPLMASHIAGGICVLTAILIMNWGHAKNAE
jgi:drug/metabolite transporter (DMT)-like permease